MSEPAAKIPKNDDNLLCDDFGMNHDSGSSSGLKMLQNYEQEDAFGFVVRLCHDVFLEVLIFGDRRRLTRLERVGRRFHLSIENFFSERPFLRLGLQISANCDDPEIIGLAWQKLSPNELLTIPRFLRFDVVGICYSYGAQPIEEKCEFIENQLLPFKLALYDANVVELIATISERERGYFNNNSKLLDFIRNRFLPICNSSRRYKFQIHFFSDANSATEIIASILEMGEIKRCSNVKIVIMTGIQKRLPVEEISKWLEGSTDGKKNNFQNQRGRFLDISYCDCYIPPFIQNAREMLDHLEKKFVESKSPAQPFTFRFRDCDVKALGFEEKTLTNTKTGEELSVKLGKEERTEIEIKRVRKEKNN